MAQIATKNDTLIASTAQTFTFGDRMKSLVFINDDASHTMMLVTNGITLYVKPGERQEVTGIENYSSVVIGGDIGSVGAYRCVASTGYIPVNVPPVSGPVVTASIAAGAVTEAKLDPLVPSATVSNVPRQVEFEIGWGDMTAQANVLFGPTFPDNAMVTRFKYKVSQTFTSATDAATIGIGFATDDSAGCVATTAISAGGNIWDAGWHDGIQTGAAAPIGEQLTAARQLQFIRAGGEDLTAGRMLIVADYIVGP